jgi:hypothetical protein
MFLIRKELIHFRLILPRSVFCQFNQSINLGFISYRKRKRLVYSGIMEVKDKWADGIEKRKY